MNTHQIYMWYKLYEKDVKNDSAKWDILNLIIKDIPLLSKHLVFYKSYGEKKGLLEVDVNG